VAAEPSAPEAAEESQLTYPELYDFFEGAIEAEKERSSSLSTRAQVLIGAFVACLGRGDDGRRLVASDRCFGVRGSRICASDRHFPIRREFREFHEWERAQLIAAWQSNKAQNDRKADALLAAILLCVCGVALQSAVVAFS